jgi:hypothetical protein
MLAGSEMALPFLFMFQVAIVCLWGTPLARFEGATNITLEVFADVTYESIKASTKA